MGRFPITGLLLCVLIAAVLFSVLPESKRFTDSLQVVETEPETLPVLLPASGEASGIFGIYDLLFCAEEGEDGESPDTSPFCGIRSLDLSQKTEGELSNETAFSPNLVLLSEASLSLPLEKEAFLSGEFSPLVLIIHTHGSEAYFPETVTGEITDADLHSENPEENIVSVGTVLADALSEAGIPTVHCEIMHDVPSYRNAYKYAKSTIQDYLAQYPTIRYVFDIHRDSIVLSTGERVRPVTEIGGEAVAQVMFVVGTDEAGANHPDWETNLTLACRLQSRLNGTYSLARPINLRRASFNEQYTPGSLLIEVGSDGNTLIEAKRAAVYLADAIAREIIDEVRNG